VSWRLQTGQGFSNEQLRVLAGLALDTARALPQAYFTVLREMLARAVNRVPRRVKGTKRHSMGPNTTGPSRRGGVPSVLASLYQDVHYALRGLLRNPIYASAAIASLALGIGANTALFGVVNAVLLQPLPYTEPDRLAIVWNAFPTSGLERLPVSGVELQALRDRSGLFEDAAGIWATTRTVLGPDEPVTVASGLVTPNFFSVLGVQPSLGRSFVAEEGGSVIPRGVIISDEFWRTHLGANPDVVGQRIPVEGTEIVVIGVLPAGFKVFFPSDGGIPARMDVYVPLMADLNQLPVAQHYLRVIGRLRAEVDMAVAQAQVAAVAQHVRETYSELAATGDEFTIVPLHADAVRAARPVLLALLAAVALFLLLASANVASLLLTRATARGHEMAVRTSIGASRRRVVQLLVVEGFVITVIGAVIGFWLGTMTAGLLWDMRPEGLSRVDSIHLDGAVLGYTAAVSALAAVLFGITPISQVSRLQPIRSLRLGSVFTTRGTTRTRKVITGAEVAVGFLLLIGAGLMIQTFSRLQRRLQRVDAGFNAENLLTFKTALALRRFPDDAERGLVAQDLENLVRDLPGVVSVGATSHLPFADWANWGRSAAPEGGTGDDREAFFADHRAISPAYFNAMEVTLSAGRSFNVHDSHSATPVVIIDRAYADRVFPNDEAVGQRLFASRFRNGDFENTWATVVGVIDDIRDRSPALSSAGQVFWPFAQSPRWELTYVVRTKADPRTIVAGVRDAVTALGRGLAVSDVRVMSDYVESATAQRRFVALLGGAFSTLAFVLAAVGLYSVVTYSTAQRTQELGLRIVMGATSSHILVDVLREGMAIGLLGILSGLTLAFGLTRLLGSLLYDVSPTDPTTFISVSLVFLAITLIASFGPAYRATRVDPIASIR
jgi:predicted permease